MSLRRRNGFVLVSPDTVSGYAFRLPFDVIERAVMRILKNLSAVEGVLYDVTGRLARREMGLVSLTR